MNKRTESQLEDGPDWPRVLARLGSVPLQDVAREFGLTPGEVAAAMVRSKTSRKAVIPQGTPEVAGADPTPSPEPIAAPDPTPAPPPDVAPTRSPGKLDAHLAAYREAVEAGAGRAFLAQLHQLVRVNLRSRIAGIGDGELLARFDEDLPPRPTSADPGTQRVESKPAPTVEAREPLQQPPPVPPTSTPPSHVFLLTLSLDGVEQQYGVVAESMGAAVAIAARSTRLGVVVAATRGLPALV